MPTKSLKNYLNANETDPWCNLQVFFFSFSYYQKTMTSSHGRPLCDGSWIMMKNLWWFPTSPLSICVSQRVWTRGMFLLGWGHFFTVDLTAQVYETCTVTTTQLLCRLHMVRSIHGRLSRLVPVLWLQIQPIHSANSTWRQHWQVLRQRQRAWVTMLLEMDAARC
jgi:hypothetical protein